MCVSQVGEGDGAEHFDQDKIANVSGGENQFSLAGDSDECKYRSEGAIVL